MSTADASSGCALLSCLSSMTSRGSLRCGRVGRSLTRGLYREAMSRRAVRQCVVPPVRSVLMIGSEAVRHPLQNVRPEARAGLIEIARQLDPVVLRWGR